MRYGAGRPGWKGKAEACQRIDVRQMKRRGALNAGYSGSWGWHNSATGEPTGSIGFRVNATGLELMYSLNGEPKAQHVPLLQTPCNYGGHRPWFACPACARRVGVLFLRRGGFYCRQCARVGYYSQSEDTTGRAWRKQSKAEAQLGEDSARPKGMHHTTYERLISIIDQCEEAREIELAAFLVRHEKWL
jgi:hypothetical protein